jgi:hypothetical protein
MISINLPDRLVPCKKKRRMVIPVEVAWGIAPSPFRESFFVRCVVRDERVSSSQ